AILADLFDGRLAAHDNRTATVAQSVTRGGTAHDLAPGREVRARDDIQQGFIGNVLVVQQGDRGVDHFAEVVRRDVGRHTHGDTARAVDQQVRDTGRQNDRFQFLFIVVRLEIDSVL